MSQENKTESFEKGMMITRIIWAAIFGSVFIYVIVCHVVAGGGFRSEISRGIPLDLIRNILFGVSIFVLFLAYFIRRHIVSVKQGDSINMPSSSAAPLDLAQFLPKYMVAILISCVLSEVVGIFGLFLFLVGDSFQNLYLFIGVSAIALFYFRPRNEEIEKMAKAGFTGGAISPAS
jgi:hypothetical protein